MTPIDEPIETRTKKHRRRGPQLPCLLCRQSEDIQTDVKRMAKKHSYSEITEWLKDRDIVATWSQVRYYLIKSGMPPMTRMIQPKNSYAEKLEAYITELLDGEFKSFSIRSLRLRGPSWSVVTVRLHEDGLIEPMRTYTPIMWRVLASKEEILGWYDNELLRIGLGKNTIIDELLD